MAAGLATNSFCRSDLKYFLVLSTFNIFSRTQLWSKTHFHKGLDVKQALLCFEKCPWRVVDTECLLPFDVALWETIISTPTSSVSFCSNMCQNGGCPVGPSAATSLEAPLCLLWPWIIAFPFNMSLQQQVIRGWGTVFYMLSIKQKNTFWFRSVGCEVFYWPRTSSLLWQLCSFCLLTLWGFDDFNKSFFV